MGVATKFFSLTFWQQKVTKTATRTPKINKSNSHSLKFQTPLRYVTKFLNALFELIYFYFIRKVRTLYLLCDWNISDIYLNLEAYLERARRKLQVLPGFIWEALSCCLIQFFRARLMYMKKIRVFRKDLIIE